MLASTPTPPRHEIERFVPEGRFVELPGRGTTFIREVAGPPGAPTVVLLHGLGATGALNWLPAFAPLGERAHVIAVDHRGHGRGLRSWRRFRLADCADDVAALADVLGIERVIAIGYSMGGPIAQLLWRRHPDRVAGLVLCATSRNFRGRTAPSLGDRLFDALSPGVAVASRFVPAPIRRHATTWVMARRTSRPEALGWVVDEVARHDPGAVLQAARAVVRFSSHEWIGEVDVPTAVVVTERDGLVPPERQRKLAAAIAGATEHSVDGDHAACGYRPREFVAALLDALDSVERRIAERRPPATSAG